MARQKGPLLLEGTMGGNIFYKNKHGYLVRSKGGISPQRIATEARFARTRETGTEFGYASRAGKLLRSGIKACCPGAEDGNTNVRLAGKLMKIVQADAVNVRGQRQLTSANVGQLEGLEWRESAPLGLLPTIDIDLASGVARCRLSGQSALRDLRLPSGATHVVLTLAVVRLDISGNAQTSNHVDSEAVEGASWAGRGLELECLLPGGIGNVLVAGLGFRALLEMNGEFVELKEGCGFRVGKGLVDSLIG